MNATIALHETNLEHTKSSIKSLKERCKQYETVVAEKNGLIRTLEEEIALNKDLINTTRDSLQQTNLLQQDFVSLRQTLVDYAVTLRDLAKAMIKPCKRILKVINDFAAVKARKGGIVELNDIIIFTERIGRIAFPRFHVPDPPAVNIQSQFGRQNI